MLSAGLFAAVLFSPSLLDVALVANLVMLVGVALLQLCAASLSRAREGRRNEQASSRSWAREPFVSIHVSVEGATADELARTLDSLRRLEWTAFEVLIATPQPLRRARVERLSARLGPRFRFLHAPPALVADRTATLEVLLEQSDPRTELVLLVDPGARLLPHALRDAARCFDKPGIGYVQLPAARSATLARGLVAEQASRRNALEACAKASKALLSSGAPLLVQRRALAAVGGWKDAGPGEERALAVRSLANGFEGRSALDEGDHGIVPHTLRAAREQRRREVFRDARTLFLLDGRTLRALGLRRSFAVVAQLTSRFDFLLLPLLSLPLLAFVPNAAREHAVALRAASVAFPLHALAIALLHAIAPRASERSGDFLRGVLVRFGFVWEGSTAWWQALFGVRLAPTREARGSRATDLHAIALPLLMAAAIAVTAGAFAYRGQLGAALACGLASSMLGAVLCVHAELSLLSALVGVTRGLFSDPGRARREGGGKGPKPRWSRRGRGRAAAETWDRVAS